MSEWVEVAGYAEDLQAAYDYFKTRGGKTAAARFVERYRRTLNAVVAFPRSCPARGHGWRQKPIPHSTFSIFYGERGAFWLLAGVQSTVRDPDRIQAMLLIREVGESPGR
jgi:plasmid stabilization system protein ParE